MQPDILRWPLNGPLHQIVHKGLTRLKIGKTCAPHIKIRRIRRLMEDYINNEMRII